MPYTIVVTGLYDSPFSERIGKIMENLAHLDEILDQLADEVVMPILGEHYVNSGLRENSSVTKTAITKHGATGNIIQKTPGQLIVGVDYNLVPSAKWAIEGRKGFSAQPGKILHWVDPETGKSIFAKHVGPAPAHSIYYLDYTDLGRIEHALYLKLTESRF